MTGTERASAALRQALNSRADHAGFVAITSRRNRRGVLLLWRDYLSREEGILLAVNEPDIQETVEDLLAVLREWRAAYPYRRRNLRRAAVATHAHAISSTQTA
jgi:hypothetical protein